MIALDRIALGLNLGLAFFLELAALGALGVLGHKLGGDGIAAVALAVALPLAAAVLWGMYAAPKAAFDVPTLKAAVKVLVFGGAAVALAAVGRGGLGAAFAAVVVANLALIAVLD